MTHMFRAALLAGAAFLGAQAAEAASLVALTQDNRLVRFDSETRRAMPPVAIRGADGALLGIDVRPADGRLYGVTATGQIVTIDVATGQATQVSRLSEPFDSGGRAVVDFNPVPDRMRLMGMNGTNFRVNVDTGAVARDGTLRYQAGSPMAETMPRITAGAYINNRAGVTETRLYTIDTLAGTYNLQAPPNDGVQQVRGQFGTSLSPATAFDIETQGETNTGHVLSGGVLFTINLDSGALTRRGEISGLPAGAEVRDIAVLR
jgi:hypothetical protein